MKKINDMEEIKYGNRETVRKNSKYVEPVVAIDLDKIIVREQFNTREDYGDIEELAQSILENGQDVPGRVDSISDGNFVLTDGHRRHSALLLLKERGYDPLFKAIVNSSKTTEEQRIIQMFTTQDNKKLTPMEVAKLIQRLINIGHNQSSVAQKIGKTASYVSQMLEFNREPEEIKRHVQEGRMSVSSSLAIKKEIRNPKKRVEAIQQTIDKKEKVTAESVTNKKATKAESLANDIFALYPETDKEMLLQLITKYI